MYFNLHCVPSATFESRCFLRFADMSIAETRTLLSLLIIFAVGQASSNGAFEGTNACAVQNVLGETSHLRPQVTSSRR